VIQIDKDSPVPLHAQLSLQIGLAIARGEFRPGDRLPTVRQLAVDCKVNSNTVARVYLELEHDGVVETRRGQGTFVSARAIQSDPSAAAAERDELSRLCAEFVQRCVRQGFNVRDVRRTLAALFATDRGNRKKRQK
jgi:GntR family transcriptional regulator